MEFQEEKQFMILTYHETLYVYHGRQQSSTSESGAGNREQRSRAGGKKGGKLRREERGKEGES